MGIIAITSNNAKDASQYVKILESMGANTKVITPENNDTLHEKMHSTSAILLSDGPRVWSPPESPDAKNSDDDIMSLELDEFELNVTRKALDLDLPILAIGRGLHI